MLRNSTIIPKKRILACGCFDFAFSHNKCKFHATLESTQKRIEKANNGIHVTDELRTKVESTNAQLNRWYNSIKKEHCYSGHTIGGVNTSGANCWECGAHIPEKFFKAATAHIFPKGIFDSIKTHPLNFLILGAGCGCHDKTHRLDTFSKMKVFKIAVERFSEFKHLIKEKHKYLTIFTEIAYGTNVQDMQ